MISHTDMREFPCEFCEKAYKYKKGLNRHIKKVHNLSMLEKQKPTRSQFKVEDYLDLSEHEKYIPKKIIDKETGNETEILFIWRHHKVILK